MSDSFYDQLANVPNDDVNVAPPSEYVDGGFGLIPEGTYNILIKDFEPVFDNGEFKKRISLKRCEVVGVPDEDSRKHLGRLVNNLTVFTTTYSRNGAPASGLGDLIRGIDDEREWSGLKEAVDIIQEAVDKSIPIQVKLVWGAYDKAGFESQNGNAMVAKSPEQKELRKKASVKGMRNFRPLADGTYAPEVAGPISGDLLEARIELDRTIPKRKQRPMLGA